MDTYSYLVLRLNQMGFQEEFPDWKLYDCTCSPVSYRDSKIAWNLTFKNRKSNVKTNFIYNPYNDDLALLDDSKLRSSDISSQVSKYLSKLRCDLEI